MGYKVILDVGPRYTGCKELIPGTVYLDNKGKELLFVGYCTIHREDETFGMSWGPLTSMVYMKMDQVNAKIKKGLLSSDLKTFCDQNMEFCNLFYMSERPRILVKELYQAFPSDYFEHFVGVQTYHRNFTGKDESFDVNVVVKTNIGHFYGIPSIDVIND